MNYEQHPLAKKFIPQPSVEEIDRIRASLADYGFDERYPIYRHEGKILVGWTRYQAATAAKVEPVFAEYDGDEPLAFMMRSELPRRHITTVHRLRLAEALRPELEKEAKRRETSGKQAAEADPVAARLQGRVDKIVAESAGVSERTATRFHAVETHGTPELKAAMHAEKITVNDAANVAKQPAPVQRKAVASVKAGKAKTATAAAKNGIAHAGPEHDQVGIPLDDRTRPIFEAVAMFKEAESLVRKALLIVNQLATHPGGLFYRPELKLEHKDGADRFHCRNLREGRRLLEACEPFARCPCCHDKGKLDRACKGCKGSGTVTWLVWRSAPADYCRAILKLATNAELADAARKDLAKRVETK